MAAVLDELRLYVGHQVHIDVPVHSGNLSFTGELKGSEERFYVESECGFTVDFHWRDVDYATRLSVALK